MIIKYLLFGFLILKNLCQSDPISMHDALSYLSDYGYVFEQPKKNSSGPLSLGDTKKVLNNSLSLFQMAHGLKITGVLDEPTVKKIKSPRCGLPDFRSNGAVAFYKAVSKWRKKNLTYKLKNENEELKNETIRILREAFGHWSNVSSLTFIEIKNKTLKSDLTISFGSRNHSDNYPFDGPGGVLAHAFFPENGEIHFDEDEYFTDKQKAGTDLKIIAVHEFGHALGLEHSLEKGAVMNPFYQGYVENFQLGKDDINGIQFLYGKFGESTTTKTTSTNSPSLKTLITTKGNNVTTNNSTNKIHSSSTTTKTTNITTTKTANITTTKTTNVATTKITNITTTKSANITTTKSANITTTKSANITTSKNENITTTKIASITTSINTTTKRVVDKIMDFIPCHYTIEAVFLGPDLFTVYALVDSYGLFRFDVNLRIWVKDSLEQIYPNLPLNSRGGAIDDNQTIWFFHDDDIYAYQRGQLLPDYPKTAQSFFYPRHPYAATFRNKKIYIYKNYFAHEFDVKQLKVARMHRSGTIFKGIPFHIDAVFRYNGFYYFFDDEYYYKFDEKTNKVMDGYPKLKVDNWFLCKL
ncbi:unnamed protein product [Brachionus calyciflorus]|uniref:Peptidase metallopeptidase domain-containing protein n=1 Tax=Brachionus calyciflorus TaxID=104777 RepID=A0A814AZQ8_9BILA|nr:unnamed protein product [Brachionus calyciflorus]